MNQRHKGKQSRATARLTRRRFIQTSATALAGATLLPPLALAESQSADAVLPAGMSTGWDKTSVVTVNAKRSQVFLDGIWRFIPALAGDTVQPKEGWAYIKVPGAWDTSSDTKATSSDFVALGNGPQWD